MTAIAWHQLMFIMYVWYSIFILRKNSSKTLQPKYTEKEITRSLPHIGLFCVSRECRSSERNVVPF